MSLLRQIQDAAASSEVPLADLLRRCQILASRLGSAELAAWAGLELGGYPSPRDLPAYRVVPGVQSFGVFETPRGIAKNAPIDPATLPAEARAWGRDQRFDGPIATIETARRGAEGSPERGVLFAWDPAILRAYNARLGASMHCHHAWKFVPVSVLAGLLDTVRTRVLGFALAIEQANPDAGDAPANTIPVPPQVVSQSFHTHIHGNVGNVAAGSTHVRQTATLHIAAGDVGALEDVLRRLGVDDDDVRALREALAADAAGAATDPEPRRALGRRAGAWIATMVGKAASGAWNVTVATATSVLPQVLGQYLGLPTG